MLNGESMGMCTATLFSNFRPLKWNYELICMYYFMEFVSLSSLWKFCPWSVTHERTYPISHRQRISLTPVIYSSWFSVHCTSLCKFIYCSLFMKTWQVEADQQMLPAIVEPDSSKRSAYHYDLWNIKYLHKFKWDNLTEEIGMCTSCFFIFAKFLFQNIFNVRCKACACLRSAT